LLKDWINQHPFCDPEAFLWINNKGKMLSYATIKTILARLGKKAGIKKRIYPHLFRVSRVVHPFNKDLNENMLREFCGPKDSSFIKMYINLSMKKTKKKKHSKLLNQFKQGISRIIKKVRHSNFLARYESNENRI